MVSAFPKKGVLATAQPFGFGPVSKLVSIASYLDQLQITFAGVGIALRYAQLNNAHFADVREFDFVDPAGGPDFVRRFDAAISVMEPRLVFAAVRERLPAYFFDSLLGFWLSARSDKELAAIALVIKCGSHAAASAAFEQLSVHETMIVAHMIATRSFAQTFAGVSERIERLKAVGCHHAEPTGPMIDLNEIEQLRASASARQSSTSAPRILLVNLGGVGNAFIDVERNSAYVEIIQRWLARLASTTDVFDEVLICSGAFAAPTSKRIGNTMLHTGLLPHAKLLELLVRNPVYLIPPGLTSLHEAAALSIIPMLLPDQHYGHTCNRRRLVEKAKIAPGACFSDLGVQADLPDDDLAGTLALVAIAVRIRDEPTLFDAYAAYMDRTLDAFMKTPRIQANAQLNELCNLLHGVSLGSVTALMQQEIMRDAEVPYVS